MTHMQELRVEQLRKDAIRLMNDFHTNGELKKFEVEEHEYFVSVIVVVGSVGDEGTLASIMCREDAHIFIGKRGKVYYPVWDKERNDQRYKNYTSMFSAYYDQKYNNAKGSYKR